MIAPGEAGIRQAAKAGWRSLSTAAVPAIWGAAYKSLTERPTGPPLSMAAAGCQELHTVPVPLRGIVCSGPGADRAPWGSWRPSGYPLRKLTL